MKTPFDWMTMAAFAAIVVIFLQRSVAPVAKDNILDYLPAAFGCALANYLGNHDQAELAIVALTAVAVYVMVVIKPFRGQ